MARRRKANVRDPVNRSRELGNTARNEQQKSLLLSEVARLRGRLKASELIRDSVELIQKSERLCEQSRKIRERRRAS